METVLLSDDDPFNVRAISAVLRFRNYRVEAYSGIKAIEKFKYDGPISILVVDIVLPDCSGTEIALRLTGLRPDLPVLFISGTPIASWTSDDIANFKRFPPNAVDYLEKPFLASNLEFRVRNLLERRPDLSCLHTRRQWQRVDG